MDAEPTCQRRLSPPETSTLSDGNPALAGNWKDLFRAASWRLRPPNIPYPGRSSAPVSGRRAVQSNAHVFGGVSWPSWRCFQSAHHVVHLREVSREFGANTRLASTRLIVKRMSSCRELWHTKPSGGAGRFG
ncbi:hypothetical protein EV652_11211 [Kribbella steppae]|uniref:Uncharacterized protein n=1 Tax=Kribbella steppae TaxID=2512223 RepID=A0A4R2H752_9ACTN|nr:hypothetical protein EV652_11211 [Kribbella steppae]